jgi:hypothetical protein
MKLIMAIIKPFKLDDVREVFDPTWGARADRVGSKGLWPAERPD